MNIPSSLLMIKRLSVYVPPSLQSSCGFLVFLLVALVVWGVRAVRGGVGVGYYVIELSV